MNKKLYYVVDKELTEVGDIMESTGNKIVTVYEILANEPSEFFRLDLQLSDNSEEEIQDYLDSNGYGDDEFQLVQL